MTRKTTQPTTIIAQYTELKRKHPEAIILLRVGDFYETFRDDAIATADILGITLTRRANGPGEYMELAGFPHHALDSYLPKLVRAGRRVAICEPLGDNRPAYLNAHQGQPKPKVNERTTPSPAAPRRPQKPVQLTLDFDL